jgi:hypothetical protein
VGVEQQVPASHADIERARPHVGRDVPRAEEEKLDVVARIADDQFFGIATASICAAVSERVPLFGTAILNMEEVFRIEVGGFSASV